MEGSKNKLRGLRRFCILISLLIIMTISFVIGFYIGFNKLTSGRRDIIIPKVIGMSFGDAKEEIESRNLKVEKIDVEEASEAVEEGCVLRQEPSEDTKVRKGDTVKLYIKKVTY